MIDPSTVPLRFSRMRQIAKSPSHYLAAVQSQLDDSLSLRIGRLTHRMVFGQPYTIFTGKVRRGKKWDEFKAANCNSEIFIKSDYEECAPIADALLKHKDAAELLRSGHIEREIRWQNMGRACSGTPDVFNSRCVVDLKKTRCARPEKFVRDGLWYGYHAQLAWYREGVALSGLGTPSEAFIVAVESVAPYPVTVLRLTERALEQGARLCRIWFEQVLNCERSNYFPGYCDSIVDFDVPDETDLIFGDEEAA